MSKQKKPIKAKPQLYTYFFFALKEIAIGMGYNLVIHGSMDRDMDLIAIPWTDNPAERIDLIIAFDKHLRGISYDKSSAEKGYLYSVLPGGRHSYVIQLNRGGDWNNYTDEQYYLDISITPHLQES